MQESNSNYIKKFPQVRLDYGFLKSFEYFPLDYEYNPFNHIRLDFKHAEIVIFAANRKLS